MFKVEFEGFDEVQRNLEKLQQRAEALGGEHELPAGEILSDAFVREHTAGRHDSFANWYASSPYNVPEAERSEAKMDDYVRATTDCSSWQAMINAGGADYVRRQLFE